MPIGTTYQDASLDAIVDSWPASGAHYALFNGVPVEAGGDGVELSGSGYTAPTFAPTDWASASGLTKTVSAPVSFGTSSGAYAEVGTYWGIVDGSGDIVYWDDLASDQVVEVAGTGTAVEIEPSIFFEDS